MNQNILPYNTLVSIIISAYLFFVRFSYESGLVVHKQRVHENIRRHLCDICAKSFNSRSDMERHKEQIHGNVKREQCNECGKWLVIYLSRILKIKIIEGLE